MKKIFKISGIAIAALFVLIMAAAIIIPVAYKDKIKGMVESQINSVVNARVQFADYKLSLFKNFPNVAFSLNDLTVTGIDSFEGDTLTFVKSFDIVFNLLSILSDKGYEVRSIIVDSPVINAIVLNDGSVNWDIMKESGAEAEVETESTEMKLLLKEIVIHDGWVGYSDSESDMSAALSGLEFNMSGDMTSSRTNLLMAVTAQKVTFVMEGVKYLSGAEASLNGTVDAQLDSMIFRFADNLLKINDLEIAFSGYVAMPQEDITTGITFATREASFKSLLSLIPAVYMQGYENLSTTGAFSLDGHVTGVYSSADSTMPDVSFNLLVSDGMVSYPDLPEKITAIAVNASVNFDGTDTDGSTVDVNRFHFELAGNPFDMTMSLSTPVSDPDIVASASGKIDLSKLQQAVPLDSISLNGIIGISVNLAGRMSMIEKEQYDRFRAEGAMTISDMTFEMPGLPGIDISNASFIFNPAFSELRQLKMTVGERSDFSVTGRLENYLPYLFADGTLKGSMALASNSVDINEIMDKIPSDATEAEDTTSLAVIQIPKNIDFTFNAFISKLVYDKLVASNLNGTIIVRDGIVTLRETEMMALGGTIFMNADYDTRDTLKPSVKADLRITSVGIKEAFNTFNTVQRLAPIAGGLGGNVSVGMKYESLLGKDMMPLISTITGSGEMRSETVQVLESKTFDQVKAVLKLNQSYTNTIKDLRAFFAINDGRLFVKPFDTKIGNIRMNVAGDQGLDQTLNYVVRTEIPRAELGSAAEALMTSLGAQAAALGFGIIPPEVIKINLKIGGTFTKPVVTPLFTGAEGGGTAPTVTSAVKEQVSEAIGETAREQADRLIREAESQAQVVRDEAARTAKMIRDEAEVQAQRLIKEAETKNTLAQYAAKKGADALRGEADKKATLLVSEAERRADQIITEARLKADELLK
jgi:hypothetical protein